MITSAALLLPLVLSQVFTTLLSGYAIKWTNRARPSFLAGFVVWAAGQGAQICFSETTPLGVIVVCLLLQGLGIGATIQSSESAWSARFLRVLMGSFGFGASVWAGYRSSGGHGSAKVSDLPVTWHSYTCSLAPYGQY
jgi:hypothetical protein